MMSTYDMDRWGDIVAVLGTGQFGFEFYSVFRDILQIEECTVFCFPRASRPGRLVIEADNPSARQTALALADSYVSGDYRGDPALHATSALAPHFYVLNPSELPDQHYRERYYESPSIVSELGMVGEVADTRYLITFARKQAGASFGRRDVESLSTMSTFLVKLLHRHRTLSDRMEIDVSSPQARERSLAYLRDILKAVSGKLSPREADICARIALGYTTTAIALHFDVSLNTVATHRKRAYAKLGICSQNELFTRYFSTLSTALA